MEPIEGQGSSFGVLGVAEGKSTLCGPLVIPFGRKLLRALIRRAGRRLCSADMRVIQQRHKEAPADEIAD